MTTREYQTAEQAYALLEAEVTGLRDLLTEVREELLRNDGRIGRASTLMARITAAVAEDLR